MNFKKIILASLAFCASSFLIQGVLGFVLAGDYFGDLGVLRSPPLLYLAMPPAAVTGIAFALLYPKTHFEGAPVVRGFKFGGLVALMMVPLLALDLPARFAISSIETWILVQGTLGTVHFAVAGALVGSIYGRAESTQWVQERPRVGVALCYRRIAMIHRALWRTVAGAPAGWS